jgi:hypothetical protein
MTKAFDDFSAYSTGAVATVLSPNWSVQSTPSGDWTQTIVDDAGDKVVQISRTSTGASTGLIVNDVIGAQSGDVEIYGRFKIDTTTPVLTAVGPVLAASDNQCYGLYTVDASNVRLARFSTTQTVSTNIATAVAFAVPDGSYVKIRLGRSGTTIRASIWLDGDPEPGAFMTSGTNTALTDLKAGIISRSQTQAPVIVTAIGIGTAGQTAPTSPTTGNGFVVRQKMMAVLNSCNGPFGPKFF